MLKKFFLSLLFLLAVSLSCVHASSEAKSGVHQVPVDFNREVRPIFSEHCYTCHGPDENKRKAGLRLDTQEGAFK